MAKQSQLIAVLDRARALGFAGPGPVGFQIEHAERFAQGLVGIDSSLESLDVVDLGAGGGLPSLPLLLVDDRLHVTLVDAAAKRTAFLLWALLELGLGDRARVVTARAEQFAHDPENRGAFDVVVARGFGPPAITVECGGPLLKIGGRLVISEPPEGRLWPADSIGRVGLIESANPEGLVVFSKTGSSEESLPRRFKSMRADPLF